MRWMKWRAISTRPYPVLVRTLLAIDFPDTLSTTLAVFMCGAARV